METKFYKVGGYVRDKLLNVKSKDIDYAVEADSYDVMKEAILARNGVIFLEKPEYQTIRAKVGSEAADFVLCRKESHYSDGRRPDSVEQGSLHDDLSRRDFTMNAIAEAEDGTLIDPFGGRRDIERGLIRCVGLAYIRFEEDSLRMLRAIRFAITKQFSLERDIIRCFGNGALLNRLSNVSEERKSDELGKCFKHDTLLTLKVLAKYPMLAERCFGHGFTLRLKPTMEA